MKEIPKRPMLAETCEDWSRIVFPVYATPKLDGFRCLTLPPTEASAKCSAVGRKLAKSRNKFTRGWIEAYLPPGLDGELVVVNEEGKIDSFNKASSAFSREDTEPNFQFWVFDDFRGGLEEAYGHRMARLAESRLPASRVRKLIPTLILNEEELRSYEEAMLAEGHEGVMIRTVDSPYKEGRSTVHEGWLLKIKRFTDDEAYIVFCYEGESNLNEATVDATGMTKRSTSAVGKVKRGIVGSVIAKPHKHGPPTEEDHAFIRKHLSVSMACLGRKIGDHPYLFCMGISPITAGGNHIPMDKAHEVVGRIVKYTYQGAGMLNKPRFPVGQGWRIEEDMG